MIKSRQATAQPELLGRKGRVTKITRKQGKSGLGVNHIHMLWTYSLAVPNREHYSFNTPVNARHRNGKRRARKRALHGSLGADADWAFMPLPAHAKRAPWRSHSCWAHRNLYKFEVASITAFIQAPQRCLLYRSRTRNAPGPDPLRRRPNPGPDFSAPIYDCQRDGAGTKTTRWTRASTNPGPKTSPPRVITKQLLECPSKIRCPSRCARFFVRSSG
jgi:hypothetical protein